MGGGSVDQLVGFATPWIGFRCHGFCTGALQSSMTHGALEADAEILHPAWVCLGSVARAKCAWHIKVVTVVTRWPFLRFLCRRCRLIRETFPALADGAYLSFKAYVRHYAYLVDVVAGQQLPCRGEPERARSARGGSSVYTDTAHLRWI